MKKISCCIIFFALFISPLLGNNRNFSKGIEHYKAKENIKAEKYLLKAVEQNPQGKAFYYLGNVLMNLHKYNEAVTKYHKALKKNYSIKHTIFNIACAYSLLNRPKESMTYLVLNYIKGDRYKSRINRDKDLTNFRKSKYYNRYINIIQNFGGVNPKSKSDLLKYVKLDRGLIFSNNEPSPGGITFYSNGQYEEFDGGGGTGFSTGGKWYISNSGKYLRINRIGTVCMNYHYTSKIPPSQLKSRLFNKEQEKYYTTISRYSNTIPFSKIRFNCYDVVWDEFTDEPGYVLVRFHKIGSYKVRAD